MNSSKGVFLCVCEMSFFSLWRGKEEKSILCHSELFSPSPRLIFHCSSILEVLAAQSDGMVQLCCETKKIPNKSINLCFYLLQEDSFLLLLFLAVTTRIGGIKLYAIYHIHPELCGLEFTIWIRASLFTSLSGPILWVHWGSAEGALKWRVVPLLSWNFLRCNKASGLGINATSSRKEIEGDF